MRVERADERRHAGAVDEWVFTCWRRDVGVVVGFRTHPDQRAWYWCGLVRTGRPLLHVTEWDVRLRADAPDVLKADGLWAEHACVDPLAQWTIENECYATAIDEPDEALGRAYGHPTALALDLEWYATGDATTVPAGYAQDGVVHGTVELPGERLELSEIAARRWHRWGPRLDPLDLPDAYAHGVERTPFRFPDGSTVDWALTPDGFRSVGAGPATLGRR